MPHSGKSKPPATLPDPIHHESVNIALRVASDSVGITLGSVAIPMFRIDGK